MRIGFLLAGLTNILGVLAFSLCFTNTYLCSLYPEVFSNFGLLCIMLWGAVYLAVGRRPQDAVAVVWILALEKAVYVVSWLLWMHLHAGQLAQVYGRSPVTGVFFTIYGPIDLAFGLFFAFQAWRSGRDLSGAAEGAG